MITLDRVRDNIADVTSEQIGKCHKVIDQQTGEDFYLVENEAGAYDEHGIIEYPVRYSEELGFTCGCKSGQFGFANVIHPSGTCKHVRWSVAAWLEEEKAMQEMYAKIEAEKKHARSIEANVPAWILDTSLLARHRVGIALLDAWVD